jgi:hypothetical protein
MGYIGPLDVTGNKDKERLITVETENHEEKKSNHQIDCQNGKCLAYDRLAGIE